MKKVASLLVIGCMFTALFMTFSVYAAGSSNIYYIASTGSDTNAGTKNAPFKSITRAQSAASSGDTVYIRGGVYDDFEMQESTTLIITYMI
ncbi:DUF1565 domain-containing protein [Paenibacillus amylolyticus]|uniref:Pectate lyase n=1 Tax=Paenibacillus amylolyticus TaxID=1451 RepID=A0A100VL97_PAEAM|nr:DUF1565 domain-containing protein [Paenibacillus amylolyticus]GAS81937.1 pectate lyase [Paenibacillus amylolyticus]